jgi:hypothetical protein
MDYAKPCPSGFWCDRGTATLSTECFNSDVLTSKSLGDESFSNPGTCFDNSTSDFGLQGSKYSAELWAERHLMPLDSDANIHPIRGKFCLDDSCLKMEDTDNYGVVDKSFDYSSTEFALRRPHVCPNGYYCNPGSASSVRMLSSRSASPNLCFNSYHCPEGSSNPNGVGSCKKGFYCRFGTRHSCPVGTFCPHDNVFDPLPCEPGSFNFMVGQTECSTCPIGYMCPSYGLKDPVICPHGETSTFCVCCA